jgi:hypothetical protein
MPTNVFVSEVARRLGCRPRDISDLFYQRLVGDEQPHGRKEVKS